MKRPLAVTGFTMLFTILVMSKQSIKVIGTAIFVVLVAFVVFMLIKSVRHDRSLPTAALSAVFALIILFSNNSFYMNKALPLDQKTVSVSGCLSDLPYENNGKNYYIIKADKIDGNKSNMKIRLVSSSPINLNPTDRITTEVKLFLLGEDNDEMLEYYKSKSLLLGGYSTGEAIKIEKSQMVGIKSKILLLRQTLTEEIMTELPNSAGGIIAGLCFGVKTYIPKTVSTAFSAAGVSHLLAVSGLHLSVWSTLLYAVLRKLRVSRKLSSATAILFIAFFAVLTGLNPPVIRAGAMLTLMFSSGLFCREADSINSIGLALTAMLMLNPYMATSLSLLLSVFATLGLVILMKPVSEFLNRPLKRVKNKCFTKLYKFVSAAVAVSISVTVATLPIYLTSLSSISSVLLISNLLMVTAGSVCMTTGGLASLFLVLGVDILGKPLVLISALFSKYLIKITAYFAEFHYSLIPINSNWSRITLAVILILFAVILAVNFRKKKAVKYITITLSAIFLTVNIAAVALSNSKLKLTAASVGNGTAVILKYKGETAVIGCGGDYYAGSAVCDIMSKYGSTSVDYLILPSNTAQNTSGVNKLNETYKINSSYLASDKLKSEFSLKNTVQFQNSIIRVADGKVQITACGNNNTSVKITYGDFSAVISTDNTDNINGERGNLLICRNSLPKGADYDNFDITVVSTDKENVDNPFNRGKILLTSQNGNISFLIYDNSKMQYWRTD